MDSNETPRIIDLANIASTLAAMEAWYGALAEAIPKMRALVSLSGALVPDGASLGFGQSPAPTLIAPGEVPPGSFHGQSIPQAAVLYLRMVKQKQKASEIAAALLRGGIQTKASNFNNQVHAALDRASKKKNAEIIKLHGANWALREWLSASVRASMASGVPANGKKKGNKKKRPGGSRAAKAAKPTAQPQVPTPAAETPTAAYRAPAKDSTEGRILAGLHTQPTKNWTADEVASAAGISRVQTVHFLLGKMAFRGLVQKNDDGTYTVVTGKS